MVGNEQHFISLSSKSVIPQQVSVSTPMVTPAPVVMPVSVATLTSMAVPAPLNTPEHMPVSMTVPGPVVVPASVPIPVPVGVPASVQVQSSVAPTALNPSREANSPGVQRPVASLSEFLEDPCAKFHTPPPINTCPNVNIPGKDPLNIPDTHPLRPPNPSPFESEPEEDRENTRLVSMEEFLRPVPQARMKVSFQTKSGDRIHVQFYTVLFLNIFLSELIFIYKFIPSEKHLA